MNLIVIIVNYRTPKLTLDCLSSLAPQIDDVPGSHVFVVDNASGDDSVPMLNQAIAANDWKRWVTVIPSVVNLGFAGGNNLALDRLLDHFETKYVLLLNSDTIVQPNVLRQSSIQIVGDVPQTCLHSITTGATSFLALG